MEGEPGREKVNVVVDGEAGYAGPVQLEIEPDGQPAKTAEQVHCGVSIAPAKASGSG